MDTKACIKCEIVKEFEEFRKYRKSCKACERVYGQNYIRSDASKLAAKIYSQSEACKLVKATYRQSEAGKLVIQNHEQSEERKASQQKYQQSEKRKLSHQKYLQSEDYKIYHQTYAQTEKFKLSQHTYRRSNKGRAVQQRYRQSEGGKLSIQKLSRSESVRLAQQAYQRSNPHITRAINAKRRGIKLNATPNWISRDQLNQIKSLYKQAVELEKTGSVKQEIDHIHPLNNKYICGLHIFINLQVLTQHENRYKSNHFEPYVESELDPNNLLPWQAFYPVQPNVSIDLLEVA